MNSRRLHDKSSFFKHTSAETAKIVLETTKLRWSNPILFNDLFDVPSEILDGVDTSELQGAMIDRLNELVENPVLAYPERQTLMTSLLLDGFSRASEELKKNIIEGNEASRCEPFNSDASISEIRAKWRLTYHNQRIICFTEQWDSASMWDRYSDANRGVLLEFGCVDNLDTATLAAKQVTYSDTTLYYNTLQGLAELLLYEPHHAVRMMLDEYTHTKATDWAPEKEWRIVSSKRPNENGDYSDFEFFTDELKSVTFGTKIIDSDRDSIVFLVKNGSYRDVDLWQAEASSGRKLTRYRIG